MKRITNTISSVKKSEKIPLKKFVQVHHHSNRQRAAILQLNSLHNLLIENGILMDCSSKNVKSSDYPSIDLVFNIHLQKIAVLDQRKKFYPLEYHSTIHNQMTYLLLLCFFMNNDTVVKHIIDSGYPSYFFGKCAPIYLYYCASGNTSMLSQLKYNSYPYFGLSTNIILSFRGLINLGKIDYDFMTLKQFLLLNEFRGVRTIDKKIIECSKETSEDSSETKSTSSKQENIQIQPEYTEENYFNIENDIYKRVLFPLDFLCIRNDFRAIDAFLSHAPDFATLSSFCFLLQCHAGITLKLLQHNANPDQTFRGYTPLHISCRLGNLDVTAIFLALNSDMNAKDFYGRSPRYYAELYQHAKIIKLLDLAEKTKILSKITTDPKHINYSIFESEDFKSRLEFTKVHLKKVMTKKHSTRFNLFSYFSKSSSVGTVQSIIQKLDNYEFDANNCDYSKVYAKFKEFIGKK